MNPAGVTVTTNAFARGNFDLIGQLTVSTGITLDIAGTLFLRSTAVLNNSGTITYGSCLRETGAPPCP
ncbi:MAG: hypothetical protein ACE5PT_15235 [Gemmatimonadales bacterium]